MRTLFAVPSSPPGGLEAPLAAHFGHCELFTLVAVEAGRITDVQLVPNAPHLAGGCLAPVERLAGLGVTGLIAGGMGARPLAAFRRAGIEVYFAAGTPSVGEAVAAAASGRLKAFGGEHTCQAHHGGADCHAGA